MAFHLSLFFQKPNEWLQLLLHFPQFNHSFRLQWCKQICALILSIWGFPKKYAMYKKQIYNIYLWLSEKLVHPFNVLLKSNCLCCFVLSCCCFSCFFFQIPLLQHSLCVKATINILFVHYGYAFKEVSLNSCFNSLKYNSNLLGFTLAR